MIELCERMDDFFCEAVSWDNRATIGSGEEKKCVICNRRLFKDLSDLKFELEKSNLAKSDVNNK